MKTTLITLTALLLAAAGFGQTLVLQTLEDKDPGFKINTSTSLSGSTLFVGTQLPPATIMFSGRSGSLLKINMIKNGKVTDIHSPTGYDSLILSFDKKRMVWKNDSTLILINK